MANDRVILELVLAGRSYSEIVAVVGCSRRGGSRVRQMVTERGLSSAAANDLFAVLANRQHRLPTMIASQTGPAHWVEALPDRVTADSIVNRLANHARTIDLGQFDMRKLRQEQTRADKQYWE